MSAGCTAGCDIKQRVAELEQLHQDVSVAIRARCTALAETQRLVSKYEYTLHMARKALTEVNENALMKRNKDVIEIDSVSRAADQRRATQICAMLQVSCHELCTLSLCLICDV